MHLTIKTENINHEYGTIAIGYHGEFYLGVPVAKMLKNEAHRSMSDDEVRFEFDFGRTVYTKEVEARPLDEIRARRLARLGSAPKLPSSRTTEIVLFDRNPDVIAEVLFRASGVCEACCEPAPFIRASDSSPYLEVHHIVPLAEGGEDTIENALGLCPNCHRRAHFG